MLLFLCFVCRFVGVCVCVCGKWQVQQKRRRIWRKAHTANSTQTADHLRFQFRFHFDFVSFWGFFLSCCCPHNEHTHTYTCREHGSTFGTLRFKVTTKRHLPRPSASRRCVLQCAAASALNYACFRYKNYTHSHTHTHTRTHARST